MRIGGVVQVLVHGSDFYEEIYQAAQDFANHDYRKAGGEFTKVMNQLSEWTTGHLCTSPACYIVSGALQYLSDLEDDAKQCASDFKGMYNDFKSAGHEFIDQSKSGFHFTKNTTLIKSGLKDIGRGINELANSVSDCHMAELAEILAKLAEELGLEAEVKWIEELLKILIKGVEVERDVANAFEDFADENWPGFGYNVVKLVKILLLSKDVNREIVV